MKKALLFSLLLIFSCNKHDNDVTNIPIGTSATVLYSGPIETDGCDWMIVINDSEYYHPDSLPDNVKHNNLHVLVNYSKTSDTFHCGIANSAYSIIHIKSIKPQ